jgi:glycosyltransferase involved in cell wall biosynthesis
MTAGCDPVRVMHIVPSLEPGGTGRLVIDLARRSRPFAASSVCCLDDAGEWAEDLTGVGIPVYALRRHPGFRPRIGFRIAQLAATHRIEILHCHHYSPFVYGTIAALARRRLRIVFTEHGRLSDARPSMKRRLVNPLLGRLPASVFTVSDELRRHLVAEGFPPGRVGVIHNGIDVGLVPTATDRSAARKVLALSDNAFIVGSAGRLDPVKDTGRLVDAFARLFQSHRQMRLVIIGDGPDASRLRRQITMLGLTDVVLLTGYRSDVRQLMAAFDVYANSSTYEGMSLTLLEAMAAALPIVATRVGGTPEIVVDGETGLLVRARSEDALAAAIDDLYVHENRRVEMGHAGRHRVERHFSLDTMIDRYTSVYRNHVAQS